MGGKRQGDPVEKEEKQQNTGTGEPSQFPRHPVLQTWFRDRPPTHPFQGPKQGPGVHGAPPCAPHNLWAQTMLPPTGSGDGRGLREAKAGIGSCRLVDCSLGLGGWGEAGETLARFGGSL